MAMSQVQLLNQPNLNLEALQVQSLMFEALSDYDEEAEQSYTLTEIGFLPERHETERTRFRVFFEAKFDKADPKENVPYRIHIRSVGYFVTLKDIAGDKLGAVLLSNALTIMYGALRGVIMQSTGAGENGSIVLPTLLMSEVVVLAAAVDDSVASLVADLPPQATSAKAPARRKVQNRSTKKRPNSR